MKEVEKNILEKKKISKFYFNIVTSSETDKRFYFTFTCGIKQE